MKRERSRFLLLALCVVLVPAALATTTWYVNGVSGRDNNDCLSTTTACRTIGRAISLASSGDSIKVAAATYIENLDISKSLSLTGTAASTTIIDGGGGATVVSISSATAHVILSKFTIRNGFVTNAKAGAGVNNSGTLTINNTIISGNVGRSGSGGGAFNGGTMTINQSTITDNSVTGWGGGIWNFGTLKLNDSTVSRNTACTYRCLAIGGGGISNHVAATLMVNNSTISGNTAAGGGGIWNVGGTAIITSTTIAGNSNGIADVGGATTFRNSIVANIGSNCFYSPTSNGHNLSSDTTCNFNGPGDLNNTDPLLGALQNNGGQTQTMALGTGSPAIDGGNPNGCTDNLGHLVKTDQRGQPRPDKEDSSGCDMGAYERQSD